MDSGKQGSSETSSDQEHRQEHVKEDNKSVTTAAPAAKRIYECTFCKRGFTNAQALGGHMNIHRKERARAKAAMLIATSSSIKSEEDKCCMSSRYVAPISTEPRKYYPVWEAQRNYNNYNYPMCFQQSVPNHYENNFVAPRSSQSSLSMNYQEFMRANLSLRIGPIDNEVMKRKRDAAGKEDEVDLELRLGP